MTTRAPSKPSTGWKLGAAACALYLGQGVVTGVGQMLVQIEAQRGASLEAQTGLLAWGALPWVLKLLWALVWDRFVRAPSRAPWVRTASLVSLQLAIGGLLGAFGAFGLGSDGASTGLPALFFVLNLLVSLQDVGADALVVDEALPAQRGVLNASMLGARAIGFGWIGGSWFVASFVDHGLGRTLTAYGIALASLALFVALSHRLRVSSASADETALGGTLPVLRVASLFETRGRRFALLLAALALLGDGISGAVAAEFLQKRAGWTLEALGSQFIPLTVTTEVVAFAIASLMIGQLGARRSVIIGSAALGLAWIAFAGLDAHWTSHTLIKALGMWEASFRALMLVGTYTLLMTHTQSEARATHFVVYMSLLNLPRLLGAQVAPKLVASMDYFGVYLVSGALALSLTALVVIWRDADADADPDADPDAE